MSIRALGRQWKAQWENRNRWYPNAPGTTERPTQGKLFFPEHERFKWSADFVEAGRRKEAGQANPKAPWEKPFLQHHFTERQDPKTGRIVKPVQPEQRRLPGV